MAHLTRDDVLDVALDNVDLALVDALMVRPSRFGRLRATGTVTGTREQPQVRAEFHVTQGGFRQFHYADLSGTTNYGGKGITLDAKLQQDASAWLTAKGYVPVVSERTGECAESHGGEVPPRSRQPADRQQPDSTRAPSGFTTALSNVTGTMQANVQVTDRPATSPRRIDRGERRRLHRRRGGATRRSGRIEFQGDRVHIDEFRLLDSQRKPLVVRATSPSTNGSWAASTCR
jgi:hypothetical protein